MSFEIDLSDKKKLHSGLVYIYQTQNRFTIRYMYTDIQCIKYDKGHNKQGYTR